MYNSKGFTSYPIIVLSLVIVISVALSYTFWFKTAQPGRIIETPATIRENYDWQVPELSFGYDWQEIPFGAGGTGSFDMSYSYTGTRTVDEEYVFGYIAPQTGVLYETYVPNTAGGALNMMDGVQLYNTFNDLMVTNGWQQAVDYGSYNIRGVVGDSPSGSLIGYVKINDNYIRTITYSYLILSDKTHMQIFVSDSINLNDFIK
jgi:hypothetical protein